MLMSASVRIHEEREDNLKQQVISDNRRIRRAFEVRL
jgi:hypothetical protein